MTMLILNSMRNFQIKKYAEKIKLHISCKMRFYLKLCSLQDDYGKKWQNQTNHM
jgi:hypothetical protein